MCCRRSSPRATARPPRANPGLNGFTWCIHSPTRLAGCRANPSTVESLHLAQPPPTTRARRIKLPPVNLARGVDSHVKPPRCWAWPRAGQTPAPTAAVPGLGAAPPRQQTRTRGAAHTRASEAGPTLGECASPRSWPACCSRSAAWVCSPGNWAACSGASWGAPKWLASLHRRLRRLRGLRPVSKTLDLEWATEWDTAPPGSVGLAVWTGDATYGLLFYAVAIVVAGGCWLVAKDDA